MRHIIVMAFFMVGMNTAQAAMVLKSPLSEELQAPLFGISEKQGRLQGYRQTAENYQKFLRPLLYLGIGCILGDTLGRNFDKRKILWESFLGGMSPDKRISFNNPPDVLYIIGKAFIHWGTRSTALLILLKGGSSILEAFWSRDKFKLPSSRKDKVILGLGYLEDTLHLLATGFDIYYISKYGEVKNGQSGYDESKAAGWDNKSRSISTLSKYFEHSLRVIVFHSLGIGVGLLKWGVETYFPQETPASTLR